MTTVNINVRKGLKQFIDNIYKPGTSKSKYKINNTQQKERKHYPEYCANNNSFVNKNSENGLTYTHIQSQKKYEPFKPQEKWTISFCMSPTNAEMQLTYIYNCIYYVIDELLHTVHCPHIDWYKNLVQLVTEKFNEQYRTNYQFVYRINIPAINSYVNKNSKIFVANCTIIAYGNNKLNIFWDHYDCPQYTYVYSIIDEINNNEKNNNEITDTTYKKLSYTYKNETNNLFLKLCYEKLI